MDGLISQIRQSFIQPLKKKRGTKASLLSVITQANVREKLPKLVALHPRNVSHVKFKWKQAWEPWLCFRNLLKDQPTEESLPASAFGCIDHSALNLLPAHGERKRIGEFKGGF